MGGLRRRPMSRQFAAPAQKQWQCGPHAAFRAAQRVRLRQRPRLPAAADSELVIPIMYWFLLSKPPGRHEALLTTCLLRRGGERCPLLCMALQGAPQVALGLALLPTSRTARSQPGLAKLMRLLQACFQGNTPTSQLFTTVYTSAHPPFACERCPTVVHCAFGSH